jgi:hypothetical protein
MFYSLHKPKLKAGLFAIQVVMQALRTISIAIREIKFWTEQVLRLFLQSQNRKGQEMIW